MPDQDPLKYFSSEVKRLNYYNSQFLVAGDFNDEQLYHNQMRRLHNRSLHTWGVVRGLEVSGTQGAARIVVAPGIAIDRLGREVVLSEQPDPIGLSGFEANSKVYVTLGYEDVFDPRDKDEQAAQATDDHYKRWTERPQVSTAATAPAAAEVLLAVVTLDRNKAVAAVDMAARRYAGSRFGSSDDGKEFSLYADPAGAWHFFDGAKGADRLTVDARGFLGVGTPSPQAGLHVAGDGVFDGRVGVGTNKPSNRLHVQGDYLNQGTGGITLDAGGEIYFLKINPFASGESKVGYQFQTKSNIYGPHVPLTFDHEGKVGVGTTAPATRLHVAGDGDTELSLQSNDNRRRWTLQASGTAEGSAPAGYFQIIDRTAGRSRLTINTDGNVGIGTNDPGTAKLKIGSGADVVNFNLSATGAGELLFVSWDKGWNIDTMAAGRHLYINRDANDSSDVLIGRAGKELVVKGNTGNVGIRGASTNGPVFPLTFPNEVGDKIALWGQSGNHYGFGIQGALLQIHSDTAGADIAFGYGSSASFTEAMRVKGSGNVGIGTADAPCRLTVRGGEKLVQIPGEYNSLGASDLLLYTPPSTNVQGVSKGDWVVIPGQPKRQVTEVYNGPGGWLRATSPGWPSYYGALYFARPADIFRADDTFGNLRFLITGEGNVGIGTTDPRTNRLAIFRQLGSNDPSASQHDFQFEIRNGLGSQQTRSIAVGLLDDGRGSIQVKECNVGYNDLLLNPAGGLIYAGGRLRNDLAEVTPVRVEDELEPGDVVVIDREDSFRVARSRRPRDTSVYGIVSSYEQAAIVIGGAVKGDPGYAPVALIGRVKAKASAEAGPIRVGDLLTTSETPGRLMRCADVSSCAGAIAGKALEPLFKGQGEILVLVTLQ
ncbi:MAG: hypothetical protein ACJ754_29260 [Pyrinomonadaceae bacterium]